MPHKFLIFLTSIFLISPALASSFVADEDAEFDAFEKNQSKQEIYDPYETLNRKIYGFNEVFDRYFLEHVARAYRKSVPESTREGIHHFLSNIFLPISALNSLAQGKSDNALATFSNFLINSTVGIGGIFEVGQKKGIYYKLEDFGQTTGYYGISSGAYLMIPFLGPSSTRDFSGFMVDTVINPAGFDAFKIVSGSLELSSVHVATYVSIYGIDTREGLLDVVDDIRKESFDPYATIRSAYLQKRINAIQN